MTQSILPSQVNTIILACEAGMGSSVMSVNSLRKKLKAAKVSHVQVIHKAARDVPADAKLVIVHKGLAKVVRGKVPNAVVITFSHFLKDPAFDLLVKSFKDDLEITDTQG